MNIIWKSYQIKVKIYKRFPYLILERNFKAYPKNIKVKITKVFLTMMKVSINLTICNISQKVKERKGKLIILIVDSWQKIFLIL